MKSISMTLLAMTVLTGVHSLKEQPLESLQDGGRDLQEDYVQLYTDDLPELTGCLTVIGGTPSNKDKLLLGECNQRNQAWRYDAATMQFHTKKNDKFCLQAGLGGPVGHGSKMRIFECDEDEALQKFEYLNALVLNGTDLCVAYRGINANVGKDPIVLKPCDLGNNNWSQD
jgi:hypothetical protein